MFHVMYKGDRDYEPITVYAVQTIEDRIQFLMCDGYTWYWSDANQYVPLERGGHK